MRPAAFWTAAFFAVHEGHQEAVMWFSAINELLMFFFGMASLWCWRRAPDEGQSAWLKELAGSGVVCAGAAFQGIRDLPAAAVRAGAGTHAVAPTPASTGAASPLVLLGVASIAQSRSNSFRFTDGSFSLHAPFWITWPHSFARLLWIWGWPARLVLVVSGDARLRRGVLLALAWIGDRPGAVQFPHLFHRRFRAGRSTWRVRDWRCWWGWRWPVSGTPVRRRGFRSQCCCTIRCICGPRSAHNSWSVRRLRTQLIDFARKTPGAIWMQCFPLRGIVAEQALRLAAGRSPSDLVWSADAARERDAAAFCYTDK